MSREIPSNCLEEKTTTCLIYTGDDIPDLDIKNGDSIEYVIKQIAQVSPSSNVTDQLTVSTFNIPVLSSCASKLVNLGFTYGITSRVNSLYFNWEIDAALPAGFGYTTTSVQVISKGVIAESDTRSGSLNIQISNLPANVRIEQRVSSSCGEVVLSYVVAVTGGMQGTYGAVFQVRDLSNTPSEMTTSQAFDTLFAMAVQNQQQIDDLRSTNAQMEIAELDARLTVLETPTEEKEQDVTYLDQTISETEPVGDALTSAFEIIRANEAKVKVLEAEIESLRTLISQS